MFTKDEIIEKLNKENQRYCFYENDKNEWIFSLNFIFYRCKSKNKNFREYDLKNKIDIKIKNIGKDFQCFLINNSIFYVSILNEHTFDIYLIDETEENYPYSSRFDYKTFLIYFLKNLFSGKKIKRIR